jgi:SCY1-like protein 1
MGNSASSLPYSIGKQQVASINNGWALHEGKRKSDGSPVAVFVAKKPALAKAAVSHGAPSHLNALKLAAQHYSYAKKLRHPHILQVYATLDTDNPNDAQAQGMGSSTNAASSSSASAATAGDYIIVTEPVVPLNVWLQSNNPSPEQVAWALECLVRALGFLHTSANLLHGNVTPESLYVNQAGDLKLWNFGLTGATKPSLTNLFIEYESYVTPTAYRSPERVQKRWDALAAAGVHVVDAYSLGVFVGDLFHQNIPAQLVKAVQRLQSPSIQRPRLSPLLQCPVFDTPYQKWQLQLEEFPVQTVQQKTTFFNNLFPNLQLLPETLLQYKILKLITAEIETISASETLRTDELYRKELFSLVAPLFYIAEHCATANIGVSVGVLFKINDRAIRGNLLLKAKFMSETFDKTTLNESVFEPLCSGFADSSEALRDLSLEAVKHFVEVLNAPNLEKLCRYLVRLQSDPIVAIRQKTCVFFAQLAPYLADTTRQKLLLPAFVRALKDAECRLVAVNSLKQCRPQFDATEIATKVLPSVTPHLLDLDGAVRAASFVVVDEFLSVLKQESERLKSITMAAPVAIPSNSSSGIPTSRPVVVAPPRSATAAGVSSSAGPAASTTATAAAAAPASSSWGLTSWMASSTKPDTAPKSAPAPTAYQPGGPTTAAPYDDDGDDGWGDNGDNDDDDDLDLSAQSSSRKQKPQASAVFTQPPAPAPKNSLFAASDDDDFFGGFESKSAKPATMAMKKPATGKLVIPKKKDKPVVQKLSADKDVSGWDDF